jgi:hypothetical protein
MAGRKPGAAKTGGRQKGTPNKIGADLRAEAQRYTVQALTVLVRALQDRMQCVQAARIILAYGHGAPRAALDVTVKPIYVMSGQPLSPEEWAAKYADAAESSDGNGNGSDSPVSRKPLDKPIKPRAGVGAARRPAKRAR